MWLLPMCAMRVGALLMMAAHSYECVTAPTAFTNSTSVPDSTGTDVPICDMSIIVGIWIRALWGLLAFNDLMLILIIHKNGESQESNNRFSAMWYLLDVATILMYVELTKDKVIKSGTYSSEFTTDRMIIVAKVLALLYILDIAYIVVSRFNARHIEINHRKATIVRCLLSLASAYAVLCYAGMVASALVVAAIVALALVMVLVVRPGKLTEDTHVAPQAVALFVCVITVTMAACMLYLVQFWEWVALVMISTVTVLAALHYSSTAPPEETVDIWAKTLV